YTFGGAMRLVYGFNGPGSSGKIDSYSSINPIDASVDSQLTGGGGSIAPYKSSYWGPTPNDTTDPTKNSQLLADARDGDVSVNSAVFSELGWIWGDVTTNGGNVTHSSPYHIIATINHDVPFDGTY